jgi:uncharacterized membrane protein YkoI
MLARPANGGSARRSTVPNAKESAMIKKAILLPLIGVSVISMLTLVTWANDEHEETVTLEQVPAAVKATILKESAGGEIKEIEVETERGKTFYEAEFVRNGKTIEIKVAPDGTLLETEEEKHESKSEEQERKVTEAEVPAPALAALKKLAGGAKLTEFAEEIEHGSTFYEGSWKTAAGSNVDALVTQAGDLVEIEEQVNPDQVPTAILAAVKKLSGPDAALFCEKKTMVLYEVKFKKGDRRHEILYTPDGRTLEKDVEKGDRDDDDNGDREDNDEDDD